MTKEQLIEELEKMHRQVSALQAAELCYKQAEEALRKSSEEIQDLYDNAPCGYHSLNEDGIFVKINHTELSWLGYSKDEIIGKKFSDVITPKSIDVFKENFSRFKERGLGSRS
jgi:PAS domain-containing protein